MHLFPWFAAASLVVGLLLLALQAADACTTFGVGKLATNDGSVFGAHTNDGGGTTDPRLVKVEARSYGSNEKRPIFASPENYPRYVGKERNIPNYFPENCLAGALYCKTFEPIGYIPQVPHTYAYFEQTYGAINEHQVGISESTCSSVFVAAAVNNGGSALLSIDQLSQIAMERATTAREAIYIMGGLGEEYGFYGESTSFEGGGESLIVHDTLEAWVFHILADPTGTSAIWAAQRIPDDSAAVVANMYIIGVVDLEDSDNFLGNANMWDMAEKAGIYKVGEPKDFTKTFSDGEYSHKYYSGRRVWGAFRLFSPSLILNPEYGNLKEDKPYPFSVKVDLPLTLHGAMAVLRDWYNGTDYSTTAEGDLAGGAFSSPDRYSLSWTTDSGVTGAWERTIALFRSSDTYIVQSRGWLPGPIGAVIWYGPHAAHGTVYTPCMVAMRKSPDTLSYAYQGVYNLSTSFWAHRIVLNLAQVKFSYMIEDIRIVQESLETASEAIIADVSKKFSDPSYNLSAQNISYITELLENNADFARESYLKLFDNMLFKYNDGFFNYWDPKTGRFKASSLGYPVWWLDAVGYGEGPPPADGIEEGVGKEYLTSALPKNEDASSSSSSFAVVTRRGRSSGSSASFILRSCIVSQCSPIESDSKHRACIDNCMESFQI